MSKAGIIRKHALCHIAALTVDEKVLQARYAPGCRMSACEGQCCRLGADVDVAQAQRIVGHADLIRQQMDDTQENSPDNWFSDPFADPDFPSGQAVSTSIRRDACVFLNKENRCAIHLAEQQGGIPDLKPFFCRAYPLCIEEGMLTIDENVCTGQTLCCSAVTQGPLTIFDLCAFELEYVLGRDGARELQELAQARHPID